MANTHTTLASLFDDTADAIREKKGTTAEIVADNFPTEIRSIATQKPEQEKTVTAGTSATSVTPDSGKVLTKVTVNPTPSQTKTATPSTSSQTISPDSGKLLSKVTVNAMPSGALSDISVSSSGLITGQVGTSGYLASGTKKTKQLTTQAAKTVTPTTSEQTAVAAGVYTTGAIKVAAVEDVTAEVNEYTSILAEAIAAIQNKVAPAPPAAPTDPDLIPENIREGIDILGVIGTMSEGVSGIDWGTASVSYGSNTSQIPVYHNLGVTPSYVALIPTGYNFAGYGIYAYTSNKAQLIYGVPNSKTYTLYGNNSEIMCSENTSSSLYTTANSTKINFKHGNYFDDNPGQYLWIAVVV